MTSPPPPVQSWKTRDFSHQLIHDRPAWVPIRRCAQCRLLVIFILCQDIGQVTVKCFLSLPARALYFLLYETPNLPFKHNVRLDNHPRSCFPRLNHADVGEHCEGVGVGDAHVLNLDLENVNLSRN